MLEDFIGAGDVCNSLETVFCSWKQPKRKGANSWNNMCKHKHNHTHTQWSPWEQENAYKGLLDFTTKVWCAASDSALFISFFSKDIASTYQQTSHPAASSTSLKAKQLHDCLRCHDQPFTIKSILSLDFIMRNAKNEDNQRVYSSNRTRLKVA